MTPQTLWEKVRCNFENDDGTLPCIEVHHLSAQEVGEIYHKIRQEAKELFGNPTFWDKESNSERPIDDVQNAAILVSVRKAEPFHFTVEGVVVEGTELPCLGIQVFQDIVSLDYRMGNEWDPARVFAFFSWLKGLVKGTRQGVLVPNSDDGPPDLHKFADAWNSFMMDS